MKDRKESKKYLREIRSSMNFLGFNLEFLVFEEMKEKLDTVLEENAEPKRK